MPKKSGKQPSLFPIGTERPRKQRGKDRHGKRSAERVSGSDTGEPEVVAVQLSLIDYIEKLGGED
jgi:hypothetical protein